VGGAGERASWPAAPVALWTDFPPWDPRCFT
jgi:hypothetical protein